MKVKMDRAKIWLPLANTLLLMAASCGNSAFALDDAAKPTTATTGNTAAFTPATDPDNPAVRFSNSETLKRAIDAVKDDVVMRAMGDELDRSMKNLKLPNYPLPYYGHYYVTDEEFIQISGSFGALSNKDSTRTRHSEVTLRVGDEKLDNTTMAGGLSGFGNYNVLVRDDNYDAIRRDLWSQTDRAYKSAVESLAGAKAQLKYVNIEDRPDSFSYAKPVISIKDGAKLDANIDEWADRVRKISAIFKEHPGVQDSSVNMNIRARTKRLMNSEGTAVKYGETGSLVYLTASAYCADGMIVSDYEFFAAEKYQDLPDQAAMEEGARRLCKRVEELSKATRASDYQGPVLFEKQAAAELASTMMPSVLCARPDSIMGFGGGDDDLKIGKPVLSKSLTVLDDPLAKEYQGIPLKSGWTYDYEGVPAQKLTLVEKGVLKALCSTRTPTRLTKASNGHSRGGNASPGHLFVSSDAKTTLADLRLKLTELGKKDELESVIVVRRMLPAFLNTGSGFNPLDIIRALAGGNAGRQGTVTLVYKVDLKTGKEELIRGARLKSVPRKNLLTMEVASDDAQPYVVDYPTDRSATTISMVTPSILLKEVELAKPPRTTEQPPYLKNPYFEQEK